MMNDLLLRLWDLWLLLTNHLWQSALVLGVLVLAERALRRAPASRRADLWTLALIKLLVPAMAGAWAWARFNEGGAVPVDLPAVTTVVAPVSVGDAAVAGWLLPALVVLTVVWLAGAGWHLIRLAADLVRQARYRRGAHLAVGPRWLSVAAAAGVPARDLLLAPAVRLPLVQGLVRPQILMPPHLIDTLTSRELEALLRHEDCHRRRRDPLRFLLGRVTGALLWFFPPVWWLLAQLRQCAEFAGDEAALAGGVQNDEYTRALARAIRRGLDPAPLVAAAAGGGPTLMRRRLARLARKEQALMPNGRFILTMAAVVVLVAAFLPLNLVAADTPPPPPPPKAAEPAPTEAVAPPAEPAAVEPGERLVEPPAAAEPAEYEVPAQDTPPPPPKKKGDKPSTKAKAPKPPAKSKGESLVESPTVVKQAKPVYPDKAKQAKVSGTVVVKVLVGTEGEVLKVKALKGPELLRKAAAEAAEASVYTPGMQNGMPVKTWLAMSFKFELD